MSDIPCGPRAEVPLTFGDKTYIASRFDLARLIELERWMRRAPFDTLKETLTELEPGELNAALVREMLAQAWDKSQTMLLFTFEGRRFWMCSVEGIARAVWLLLKPKHPELKYLDVVAMLPPDRVDECTDVIAQMMGHPTVNPTGPAAKPETMSQESAANHST